MILCNAEMSSSPTFAIFRRFKFYGRKMLHEDLDFAFKLCVAL